MSDIEVATFLKKHVEENTPLEGNRCKEDGCDGEIVKKVTGLYRGKFSYSIPACNKCCRMYFFAKNVLVVGEKEFFEKILRTPFVLQREIENEPPVIAQLRTGPFTI